MKSSIVSITPVVGKWFATMLTMTLIMFGSSSSLQANFTFTVSSTEIADNADDLCYDKIDYSVDGFPGVCMDFGLFKGGMNCRQTIRIKNWRAEELTNVQSIIDISGLSGNVFGDCGIDGNSGNCSEENNLNFGPMGIFNRAIVYDPMPDYNGGDAHTIYEKALMNAAIFSGQNLYGSYIKNGKLYRGRIKPCHVGYCQAHDLEEGFHVIDPDGGDSNNSFEIYCDRSSRFAPRDLIALPIKNKFNNFLYNSDHLSSTDYYTQARDHSTGWQAIEVNANTNDNSRIPVLFRTDWEPLTTDNYSTMGAAFSNINLTATPFRIDWSHSTISHCTESKLRHAYYGQDVKINTLDYDNARCKIDEMNLALLDDYQYLIYKSAYHGHTSGEEVLERTCKELSEAVPIDVLPSEDIKGHYWITPHRDKNSTSGYDRSYERTDITKASERPIVAYCWYQTDLNWAWTFLLAMDGKRTISKDDLVNKEDTCSALGLIPFVPNSEETFERVRNFLKTKKSQWDQYTGTIQEKIHALYGNNYYLYHERQSLIWPYGSFGVYYDDGDSNHHESGFQWGGEDFGEDVHHPGPMSGSPMHNMHITEVITQDYPPFNNDEGDSHRDYYSWGSNPQLLAKNHSYNGYYSATDTVKDGAYEYKDTMGAKGWTSILQELNITDSDEWFISRTGAGENFSSLNGNYPYYEPNGNYREGCWLNYLFDSQGRVRHNDDWDCNYPYYDYMCMADTNYINPNRSYAPAGLFNIVRSEAQQLIKNQGTDPLPQEKSPLNSLYMQPMDATFNITAVALDSDKRTLHTYRGLVNVELTATPNYREGDSDAVRQEKCEQEPTLRSDPIVLAFDGQSSFSDPIQDSYPKAHQGLTYRIKYLKNPNYDEAIQWNCATNTFNCIWGMLTSRIYDNSKCNGGTGYPESDCPCASVCKPGNGQGNNQASSECLKCLFGSPLAGAACARDSFSVRPYRFDINSSDSDSPNLLRSGQAYSFKMVAVNGNGNAAEDYNVARPDIDVSEFHKFRHNSIIIDDTNLSGNVAATYDFNDTRFRDGVSSKISTPNEQEVLDLSFDDVGKVISIVRESNWTAVDQQGPMDCIQGSGRNTPVQSGTDQGKYGCDIEGNITLTFIPHHFNVEAVHLHNHRDGNFTYLSNDLNMSAHIHIMISARNAQDHITENFRQGTIYYENPVSVDLNVTKEHPLGNDLIKQDIPVQKLLGFGGSDANGTHTIAWNDANETQRLMFNYKRHINQSVDPFDVNGSDINITVHSTYMDALTPSGSADINGSGTGDRNATFYYSRVRASKFFYDDVTENNVKTPIYIVVYANDPSDPLIQRNQFEMTNEYEWYLNTDHQNGDGSVTLVPTDGNGTVTTNPSITGGIDEDVTVTANATTRPLLVDINLTGTDPWLIYNPDANKEPAPFYRVRFIGASGWAGHGKTGNVVESNASKKKLRRLEW